MPKLPVEALPPSDNGRHLVRLNHKHRGRDIKRYGIAKLSNTANGKTLQVLMLGHDRDDAIFMPYDIRTALEVTKGGQLDFKIEPGGFFSKLRWYVGSPDPAVHIPAWIAVTALGLTLTGAILAFVSLW